MLSSIVRICVGGSVHRSFRSCSSENMHSLMLPCMKYRFRINIGRTQCGPNGVVACTASRGCRPRRSSMHAAAMLKSTKSKKARSVLHAKHTAWADDREGADAGVRARKDEPRLSRPAHTCTPCCRQAGRVRSPSPVRPDDMAAVPCPWCPRFGGGGDGRLTGQRIGWPPALVGGSSRPPP
jgi:hypothetical protein